MVGAKESTKEKKMLELKNKKAESVAYEHKTGNDLVKSTMPGSVALEIINRGNPKKKGNKYICQDVLFNVDDFVEVK